MSRPRHKPTYAGISFCAVLLDLAAASLAILGVLWVMAAPAPPRDLLPILLTYWPAAVLLIAALLISMLCHVARAVRDVARRTSVR